MIALGPIGRLQLRSGVDRAALELKGEFEHEAHRVAPALGPARSLHLSPSKHDSDEALINTAGVGADDAAIRPPPTCTESEGCPAWAPSCVAGACGPCTQHADCAGFSETPACGRAGTCVTCAPDELRACTGPSPSCDVATGQCLACSTDAQCADPQRSACNPTTHVCEACSSDAQCAHLPGRGRVHRRTCVECTAQAIEACRETLAGGEVRQSVCDAETHRCDRSRLARSRACASGA